MEEKELIEKCRSPENRSYGFHLLVKQYQEKIYRHIRRMVIDHEDTDDLVQETFIKVWQHLDAFRGDSGLYTWIYRIATNECLQFLRKKKRKHFLALKDVEKELSEKIDHDPYIEGSDIEKRFHKALLSLPEKQRLVFNMRYFEEMSYDQISKITGNAQGGLKAQYHHAIKKLKEKLSHEFESKV